MVTDFFVQNSIPNNFYFKLFLIWRIFLATSSPKLNQFFCFFYIIIFQRWESFEPPSSTLEGDKHMRSQTFSYEIQCRTIFILNFFWCDGYSWQCQAPNGIYLPIFVHNYFSKMENFSSPIGPPWEGGDRLICSWTFLYKIQFQNIFI